MAEAMTIRVRAFAGLREALGFGDTTLRIEPGLDVAGLLAHLEAAHPGVHLSERRFAIAVNRTYVGPSTRLADGDEIALIPPVSGGAGPVLANRLFEVTDRALSLDEVAGRLLSPARGGITVFAGTVRGITPASEGLPGEFATDYLEYEAYPEMAEPVLAEIGAEVQARWPDISALAIVHRIGRLAVGETAVVVAAAAAHRQNTFAACQYAIDRVKQIAPIWKREVGADGAIWVEGPESNVA
jgi:molybdopterin converting factor subunit 1